MSAKCRQFPLAGSDMNGEGAGFLEQLPDGLDGGLQLAVDGCVGLDRIETQASQEVTSVTLGRIDETALKTSRQ